MKNCPNCNEEVIENFEVCWNCNYSFVEKSIVEFTEEGPGQQSYNCLRCDQKLVYNGLYKFHEGGTPGVFGNIFHLLTNRESFDVYVCPKCGKAEFFVPWSQSR